jgi:hypothetical protein
MNRSLIAGDSMNPATEEQRQWLPMWSAVCYRPFICLRQSRWPNKSPNFLPLIINHRYPHDLSPSPKITNLNKLRKQAQPNTMSEPQTQSQPQPQSRLIWGWKCCHCTSLNEMIWPEDRFWVEGKGFSYKCACCPSAEYHPRCKRYVNSEKKGATISSYHGSRYPSDFGVISNCKRLFR